MLPPRVFGTRASDCKTHVDLRASDRAPVGWRPGTTVTGQLFQEAPGGKGANQAVTISRLGGRSAFMASVGSDPRGGALVERARRRVRGHEECVDTSAIVRDSTAPTGVALIAVDASGERPSTF